MDHATTESMRQLCDKTDQVLSYFKDAKNTQGEYHVLQTKLTSIHALLLKSLALSTSQFDYDVSPVEYLGAHHADLKEFSDILDEIYETALPQQSSTGENAHELVDGQEINSMSVHMDAFRQILERKIKTLGRSIILKKAAAIAYRGTVESNLSQDQECLQSALQWISSVDHCAIKDFHYSQALPGTGQGFSTSAGFQNWLTKPRHVLLCPGPSGSGKSVTTAQVIHDLENQVDWASDSMSLAYLFFSPITANECNEVIIMSGILKQLVAKKLQYAGYLLNIWTRHREYATTPSVDELMDAIKAIAAGELTIFLIVDTPDERDLKEGALDAIFRCLRRLRFETNTIRLLITSTRIDPMRPHFEGFLPVVHIKATAFDVRQYTRSRFDEFRVQLDDSGRIKVEDVIVKESCGLFLWARFMVDRFVDARNQTQLERLLVETKDYAIIKTRLAGYTYHNHYTDILVKIDSQSKVDCEIARKALLWVLRSTRRLRVDELLCALSVDVKTLVGAANSDEESGTIGENVQEPQREPLSIERVMTVCAGLIAVDPQTQTVNFLHDSLFGFLTIKRRKVFEFDHCEIAGVCLAYLHKEQSKIVTNLPTPWAPPEVKWTYEQRMGDFDTVEIWQRVEGESQVPIADIEPNQTSEDTILPLLDYAAESWGVHSSFSAGLTGRTCPPLLLDSARSARAFLAAGTLYRPWKFLNMDPEEHCQITGLHLSAALGLPEICRRLLNAHSVDGKAFLPTDIDSRRRTPLMWAAHHGHYDAFCVLISASPPSGPEQCCDRGETALHYAARQGHSRIVKDLLERSVSWKGFAPSMWNVNRFQETALTLAALHGHGEVVRMLVNSIASTEAFRSSIHNEVVFGIWPIHRAAQSSSVTMFKCLVDDYHVSIDPFDPKGQSPFAIGVYWGNEAVVRYFFREQKQWLDSNKAQVILGAHLAAAKKERLGILKRIVDYASYVLTAPCVANPRRSLLATAIEAGNNEAATFIAVTLNAHFG